MGIFDGAKSITMNNKVVSSITTDTGVLYQKKVNSQVSIDVPLNLTYSDEFNITGYLTSNGIGIVGATVNLLVGSTVVDFTTTTTGGAYSFTNYPVSTGNHSFQVVFNGNSEYFASESSIVNRVVNKETSVLLNVTQTGKIGFASTGTGYNSVTPACILRTDDGEAISFATIHFGDAIDSTQIDGYAQGNDVTYPTTSLNIVYEGDSNYTPSSVLASFEYQIPTLLNLSGTNIISKDETATVNGVLYDQDGDIIPNCQLEYNIKHNNTIITSGTVRTDNNGAITLNYTGTGIGDVDITVSYGRLLQETFVIEDLLFYPKLDGTETIHQIQGSTTISNNEMSGGSGYIGAFDNTGNWEITFEAKWSNSSCGIWIIKSDETSRDTNDLLLLRDRLYGHVNGSGVINTGMGTTMSANTYYPITITKNGTTITLTANNQTTNVSWSLATTLTTLSIGVDAWGGISTIKNIKVKAL